MMFVGGLFTIGCVKYAVNVDRCIYFIAGFDLNLLLKGTDTLVRLWPYGVSTGGQVDLEHARRVGIGFPAGQHPAPRFENDVGVTLAFIYHRQLT